MQDVVKRIISIIISNFPNGVRDDFIDVGKVLRIYSANYSDEISRVAVIDAIRTNGIETDGRFYFLPDEAAEHVLLIFDELLKKYPIVYYAAAYEKHCDFFFAPAYMARIHEILAQMDGWHLGKRIQKYPVYGDQKKVYYRNDANQLDEEQAGNNDIV